MFLFFIYNIVHHKKWNKKTNKTLKKLTEKEKMLNGYPCDASDEQLRNKKTFMFLQIY